MPSIFATHRGATIGRKRDSKIPKTPGPGDYEILPNNYTRGVKLTPKQTPKEIERHEELASKLPYRAEEPGPGTYNPMFDSIYPQSPRYSFGEKGEYQTAVSLKDNGIPSPDGYDIKNNLSSPKFTLKGRNFVPDPDHPQLMPSTQ